MCHHLHNGTSGVHCVQVGSISNLRGVASISDSIYIELQNQGLKLVKVANQVKEYYQTSILLYMEYYVHAVVFLLRDHPKHAKGPVKTGLKGDGL